MANKNILFDKDELNRFLSSYGKKSKLLILIAALGIIITLLIIATFNFTDKLFNSLFPKPPSHAISAPINISTPTTPTIKTTRGIIASIVWDNLTISVASSSASANFSLTQTRDFQRAISGSLESDDLVASPSAKAQLQAGQEVLVIWDKNATQSAKAVYILR